MTTNETLVKTLRPVYLPSIEDSHLARVKAIQHTQSRYEAKRTYEIYKNSAWAGKEIEALLHSGFSLFVGDKFLSRCRYVAALRTPNNGLAAVREEGRWAGQVRFNGDIPDSVIDKIRIIDHLKAYGWEGETELFNNLGYLVVSTAPLPVVKYRKVDPFLLAFKWENTRGPFIEVSRTGRIKDIREIIGKYSFLIVGMWDMDKEIFV